jgi:hypothetical protein
MSARSSVTISGGSVTTRREPRVFGLPMSPATWLRWISNVPRSRSTSLRSSAVSSLERNACQRNGEHRPRRAIGVGLGDVEQARDLLSGEHRLRRGRQERACVLPTHERRRIAREVGIGDRPTRSTATGSSASSCTLRLPP